MYGQGLAWRDRRNRCIGLDIDLLFRKAVRLADVGIVPRLVRQIVARGRDPDSWLHDRRIGSRGQVRAGVRRRDDLDKDKAQHHARGDPPLLKNLLPSQHAVHGTSTWQPDRNPRGLGLDMDQDAALRCDACGHPVPELDYEFPSALLRLPESSAANDLGVAAAAI